MKTNKEILNKLGSLLTEEIFDTAYGSINEILDGSCPNPIRKDIIDILNKLDTKEKIKLQSYTYEVISGTLFDFLRVFEENEEFKIIYEKNNQKVNLIEISEMLKAEPIIENGWIERFSKELKK